MAQVGPINMDQDLSLLSVTNSNTYRKSELMSNFESNNQSMTSKYATRTFMNASMQKKKLKPLPEMHIQDLSVAKKRNRPYM